MCNLRTEGLWLSTTMPLPLCRQTCLSLYYFWDYYFWKFLLVHLHSVSGVFAPTLWISRLGRSREEPKTGLRASSFWQDPRSLLGDTATEAEKNVNKLSSSFFCSCHPDCAVPSSSPALFSAVYVSVCLSSCFLLLSCLMPHSGLLLLVSLCSFLGFQWAVPGTGGWHIQPFVKFKAHASLLLGPSEVH